MRTSCTLLCATALLLSACRQSGAQQPETADTQTAQQRPRATRDFPVMEDFYQITVIGAFDIEIAEGPCSVTGIGDSIVLSTMRCEIGDGGLILSTHTEERDGIAPFATPNGVRMVIHLPELRILANCAGARIHASSLHASRLHVGGMGAGSIDIDTLCCGHFRYEGSRKTDAAFPHVVCDTAEVLAFGQGQTTVGIDASQLVICDVSQTADLVANVKAPILYINSSTSGSGQFGVDVGELLVQWRGTGELTLSGQAQQKNIIDKQRGTLTDNVR